MSGELTYSIFRTGMGWAGVLASARGLLASTLPYPSAEAARRGLGERVNQAQWSPGTFADLAARLETYFSGGNVFFADELDLSAASPFQRQVWRATRLIPFGETRSYRWVASRIDRPGAARAVGQALGKNPLPIIIPCHRVIASGGDIGGFTGGLEMKKRLLALEKGVALPGKWR